MRRRDERQTMRGRDDQRAARARDDKAAAVTNGDNRARPFVVFPFDAGHAEERLRPHSNARQNTFQAYREQTATSTRSDMAQRSCALGADVSAERLDDDAICRLFLVLNKLRQRILGSGRNRCAWPRPAATTRS